LKPLKTKAAGLKPTASKKKTTGFFFLSTHGFYKLVLFYLAGPWIDFFKKKSSKKLKKPK
jgi:formate hydrogenlyase subunit 3/multisubunit Na+/H+ antiporter MnhD subunit